MYSHVNTCVLGREFHKLYHWNHPVNVSGCNPENGERLCQKIAVTVAYDNPQSGKFCIFIFHHFIRVNHLNHHMLCTMQCLINGIEVNETPKFLLRQPTDKSRAIVVYDPDRETPMVVPLSINGITSYFPYRKLTRSEFEDGDVSRIYFTVKAPAWDPSD